MILSCLPVYLLVPQHGKCEVTHYRTPSTYPHVFFLTRNLVVSENALDLFDDAPDIEADRAGFACTTGEDGGGIRIRSRPGSAIFSSLLDTIVEGHLTYSQGTVKGVLTTRGVVVSSFTECSCPSEEVLKPPCTNGRCIGVLR